MVITFNYDIADQDLDQAASCRSNSRVPDMCWSRCYTILYLHYSKEPLPGIMSCVCHHFSKSRLVSIVSYNRLSLMIIVPESQFHVYFANLCLTFVSSSNESAALTRQVTV